MESEAVVTGPIEKARADVIKLCGIMDKISNDLNAVRGIKAKLTSIGTTAETIATDVKS